MNLRKIRLRLRRGKGRSRRLVRLGRRAALVSGLALLRPLPGWSASGAEGAGFLDIPVGGRPAALGGAYSALASDAYAPIWNPAGLGSLKSGELATMHLSYLESMSYEFASVAFPLSQGQSVGAAIQYFRPGDFTVIDAAGRDAGRFSGHYGAYSLAYGRELGGGFSAGVTAKLIEAKIADVGAQSYAADIGALYRYSDRLRLAAVAANLGSKLAFFDQADSLPQAFRLGAAYQATAAVSLSVEGVARAGDPSARIGVEWKAGLLALRAGYRSDVLRELSPMAGLTTGVGLEAWGQELEYAWVPVGALGSTQYFSLVFRFGQRRPQGEASR